MDSVNPENITKLIDHLSKSGGIAELSEYVAKNAKIQDHVSRVNYNELLDSVTKELCSSMTNSVEVSGPEFIQIHVQSTRFAKKPVNSQKFLDEIGKVMNSPEFKVEVERKISSMLSDITGHCPGAAQDVIDMEVSSGSSPDSLLSQGAPPAPVPPPVLAPAPVPPPVPAPLPVPPPKITSIPLPPGPAPPTFFYRQ